MKHHSILRTLAAAALVAAATTSVQAQDKKPNPFGIANRVGIGVGAGTDGMSFDVAVPFGKYVQARVGVSTVPSLHINETVDVSLDNGSHLCDMDVKADLQRTTFDVKADVYPFANSSSFFVTAGLSFGGNKLIKLSGHSDELAQKMQQGEQYVIEIGDYEIPVDRNGNIGAGARVASVRPYLGLGFGRLIPKKRFGVRFELGAQFQGEPKIYADGVGDLKKVSGLDTDDDISKVLGWLKVYPVLSFSLRGRIL